MLNGSSIQGSTLQKSGGFEEHVMHRNKDGGIN